MRSLSFDPQILRKHLRRHKIATLPELKEALGTNAALTVFRKLKPLDYLSSYTHHGRYYVLRESARFDDAGLWSHERPPGAVAHPEKGAAHDELERCVKRDDDLMAPPTRIG